MRIRLHRCILSVNVALFNSHGGGMREYESLGFG